MMHKLLTMLLVLTAASAHAAEPSNESLIAAWEKVQRGDPEVQLLEKRGSGRYRLETSHFDYAGPAEITDIAIDPMPGFEAGALGVIHVELPALSQEARRQRAHSLGIWQRNNTLYWSETEGRWLDSNEWGRRVQNEYGNAWLWGIDWFWILFLVIFAAVLWWTTRKANRQMEKGLSANEDALEGQRRAMELTETSLRLHEETNALLREIRDGLRNR